MEEKYLKFYVDNNTLKVESKGLTKIEIIGLLSYYVDIYKVELMQSSQKKQ